MRAGMSPLDNFDAFHVLTNNTIGDNLGNMLFPYSIARTLMLEDVEITTIKTERSFSREEINRFNKEYDCLVLPFANAFRRSFIPGLEAVAKLVDQLKIPCIVIGIGMQKKLNNPEDDIELDAAAKKFMKSILKKTTIVGVRGEETAAYLKKLGFREEQDFTVIGCPSMYTYGKDLPKLKLTDLTEQSSLSFNSKITLPAKFHTFLHNGMKQYKNYHYVPQVIEEIYRMYVGMPYPSTFSKKKPKYFPLKFSNNIYKSGKGISFINVPSWLEYLKTKDLSVGSRIHGNIAALLAGTPCFIVVSDRRILELVQYHNIPHILMDDLTEDMTIAKLYEKADYTAIHRGHEERFMHYLDFLHKNGLQTIYDKDGNAEQVPFDQKVAEIPYHEPLYSISSLPINEQALRVEQFLGYYRDKTIELEQRLEKESMKNIFAKIKNKL